MLTRTCLAAALFVPTALLGQEFRSKREEPTSRAGLIAFLKSDDAGQRAAAFEAAVGALTGRAAGGDLTPDAVASDLVDVAVSNAPDHARSDAIAALLRSTDRDNSRPYKGAAKRLEEIYRRASDPAIKMVAMAGAVRLSDAASALALLIPIAEREGVTQAQAINLIAELNTKKSVAFLRALDAKGTVTEEWASDALKRHAANGYRATPQGRRPRASPHTA